jgi:hypothetical protein
MRSPTPIAAPGTARWRHPAPTTRWPPIWSGPQARAGARRAGLRSRVPGTGGALTVDPGRRARRALAAARAKHQAGAPDAALALLASAQAGPLDELQRTQGDLLRAEIVFTSNHGSDAPPMLLDAAKQLEPLDVTLARETYLEALWAAQFAGRFVSGSHRDAAQAARAAPASPAPRAPDLLLDGLAVMLTEGHAAGAPLLKRALGAFRDGDLVANGGFRWLWLADAAAIELWDHDSWDALSRRALDLVREDGALTLLPLALTARINAQILAGELAAAASSIDEVTVAGEATGTQLGAVLSLLLAAWRGRQADLAALKRETREAIVARGEGIGLSAIQWASALLHNGLGRYESALTAARQLVEPPERFDVTVSLGLPELVEAAGRSGQAAIAEEALAKLSERTRAAGTDWALGLEARCRALLSEPGAAEPLYQEAIERLGRTRVRGEHARAHLLYGEWLRRAGRRTAAREQLRTADRMLSRMGIEAFAGRARRELVATGETVRKRRAETRDELTAQEWQIARLARDGLSNPEIATRLFLSPRTWSGICARCSPSSGSAPGWPCTRRCPTRRRRRLPRRPGHTPGTPRARCAALGASVIACAPTSRRAARSPTTSSRPREGPPEAQRPAGRRSADPHARARATTARRSTSSTSSSPPSIRRSPSPTRRSPRSRPTSITRSQEFRASVGAQWPFLSDPERIVQKDLEIQEYTDPEHDPMIPHTLVLKPGLVVHSVYNGYWFWGRPSVVDLWHDLRDVSREIRPDWDLSAPGLRDAWAAGDVSHFHGWDRWSPERAAAARSV